MTTAKVTEAFDLLGSVLERVCEKTGAKPDAAFNICSAYQKEINALLLEQKGTKEERMAIDRGIEELYTNNPMLEMTAGDFLDYVKVRRNDSNRQYFYTHKKEFLLEHKTDGAEHKTEKKEAAE